jgi:hypothetical protein
MYKNYISIPETVKTDIFADQKLFMAHLLLG